VRRGDILYRIDGHRSAATTWAPVMTAYGHASE
jgi:hypothetical protein